MATVSSVDIEGPNVSSLIDTHMSAVERQTPDRHPSELHQSDSAICEISEQDSTEEKDDVPEVTSPREVPTLVERARDGSVRRRRVSVEVNANGDVVVDVKGDGAASTATQALVRDHVSRRPSQEYTVLTELGKGCFGVVTKVKHNTTGAQYAMKHIDLSSMSATMLLNFFLSMREIELMKKLDHPNVIKIYEVFRGENHVHLVMELCTGGELQDKLDNLPGQPAPPPFPDVVPRFVESEARDLIEDMLKALHYIHSSGIVHRDIKMENYIFAGPAKGEGDIKMIDFGLSRSKIDAGGMQADVGSAVYKVCHMMLTGIVPWEGDTQTEITESILQECSSETAFDDYLSWFYTSMDLSAECASFIKGLLTPDPKARMTTSQALDHEWISGSRVQSLIQGLRKHGMPLASSTKEQSGMRRKVSLKMVDRLKAFKQSSKLQRMALLAMSFGSKEDHIAEFDAAFRHIDTDGDGVISLTEFTTMMIEKGVTQTEEIKDYFDAIDQDHTGSIKYSEFIAAMVSEQTANAPEQLEAAFHRLDVDNSGSLDKDDLKILLGKTYTQAEVARVLETADTDGDGKIDLAEFKAAMAKHVS